MCACIQLYSAVRILRRMQGVIAYDQFFIHVDFRAVIGDQAKLILPRPIDTEDSPIIYAKPFRAAGHAGNSEREGT